MTTESSLDALRLGKSQLWPPGGFQGAISVPKKVWCLVICFAVLRIKFNRFVILNLRYCDKVGWNEHFSSKVFHWLCVFFSSARSPFLQNLILGSGFLAPYSQWRNSFDLRISDSPRKNWKTIETSWHIMTGPPWTWKNFEASWNSGSI